MLLEMCCNQNKKQSRAALMCDPSLPKVVECDCRVRAGGGVGGGGGGEGGGGG